MATGAQGSGLAGDYARGFNPRIESLRGITALTVAAYHMGQAQYFTAQGGRAMLFSGDVTVIGDALARLWGVLANGPGAVVLLFAISGFVLRLSLDRTAGSERRVAGIYLIRRILRLWPPIVLMVAIYALFFHATGYALPQLTAMFFTPDHLFWHAILADNRINGVVWTLQVEAFAAPVILLAWLVARRLGDWTLWVLAFVLCGMSFTGNFDDWLARIGVPPTNYIRYLYVFVIGMLVPNWGRFLGRLNIPPRVAALYPLCGALLILAAPPLFGVASNFKNVAEALGAGALLTGIAFGMNSGIGRVLELPILRFFGRISYSFYLLHPLTLAVVWSHPELLGQLVAAGWPTVVLAAALFFFSTAAVVPLAMLSHALTEAPMVRLAARIGPTSVAAPAGPAIGVSSATTPAAVSVSRP